jgi:O-antigen/teichoic acid export membrane protein
LRPIKKLAGQTLVYGLGTMVPRLLNYMILTPYFTYIVFRNNLGEYGKLTELYAYVSFLLILLTYGMETAYFRFYNNEKERDKVFSTILTSIFCSSALFIVIVGLFLNGFSRFLDYSGEKDFILIVACIVAVEAFTAIPFAKLRVQEKAKKFAILKSINVAVNIFLIILFYNILPSFGIKDFLVNNEGNISVKFVLLANLITSFSILLLLIPDIKEYTFRMVDWNLLKRLLKFGWPLLIAGFAGTINETLDRGILKQLLPDKVQGLHDLAVYGGNYKIAAFILLFIQMYRFAMEPFFFNYAKNEDSKRQYAVLMNLFVGVTVFMGVFIMVFLDYIKYFIDPKLHEGLFIVPYIIVAYIFSGIYYNHSIWFKLSDKTIFAIYIASIGAIATIVLNVMFVPEYSYLASAVATVIAYGLMVLFSFVFSVRYYYVKYNIGRMLLYFIVGASICYISSKIIIGIIFISIVIKIILVSIFAIFVVWKENLFNRFVKRVR